MSLEDSSTNIVRQKVRHISRQWIGPVLVACAYLGLLAINTVWTEYWFDILRHTQARLDARADKHNLRLKHLEEEVLDMRADVEKMEPMGRTP